MALTRRVRTHRPLLHAAGARARRCGVGDDCALLAPAPGMQLAVSSDMLVEGRHFLVDGRARAPRPQGAGGEPRATWPPAAPRPLAFTLALALPAADEASSRASPRGLFALADAHGCELVGGDTTRGPLDDLHHGVRRGAGRRGAAALGRARRRRPLGQRHARRRPPGARGVSRHASPLAGDAFARVRRRWSSRRRASRSASRCAASRAAAIDVCRRPGRRPRPRAAALRRRRTWSTSTRCRAAPMLAGAGRWRCSASACSPAATTTSSFTAAAVGRDAVPPRPATADDRGDAHRPHRAAAALRLSMRLAAR